MNRREFLVLAIAGGSVGWIRRFNKERKIYRCKKYTQARLWGTYPGKIRKLNQEQIRCTALWNG